MNLASRLVLVGMGLTIIGPLSANLRISAPMAGFVLFFERDTQKPRTDECAK